MKTGQEARADELNADGRLEGMIPVLSEFHIAMEILKIIFNLAYSTGKSLLYDGKKFKGCVCSSPIVPGCC